jgi:hypothetical protein
MSVALRDRFFTLSDGRASTDEVDRYRAEVDTVDADPVAELDGLAVSWHPTARFKAVRFVDAERLDAGVRDLFARPSVSAPDMAAVFVDPREYSFRTFENILPLDRLFADIPVDVDLVDLVQLAAGAVSFTANVSTGARERLDGLDGLGLYVPPLNAGSRGGERFIFHSAVLAEALTAAVSRALPASLLPGFSHVNPVFRANRFSPGDANFHRHRDTPYYDAARNHVSKFTMLLYLTGGTGAPALDLGGDVALATIEPFTCVIFDQRYEHEGAPYRDGRKVFLRTELVYTDAEVAHDPEIGALFSKACYLTGESVFAPELSRHADDYYNRVAAAHWQGLTTDKGPEPFLHKEFRGAHFVANGYDFWFGKQDGLSLAECAAITLLDYFNCRIGDTTFRAQCRTETIEADDTGWIPEFLNARRGGSTVLPFDKSLFFPPPEQPDTSMDEHHECPFHTPTGEATRESAVIDIYGTAQKFAKAHIMPAPILMLGQDVVLDPEKFLIQDNRITVLGAQPLAPVNFASCQCYGDGMEYDEIPTHVGVAATVGVAHFLVPPILFTESADTYHLTFDFFRNSWMVDHRQATIPVPMITKAAPASESGRSFPWQQALDPALADDDAQGSPDSFWRADKSPILTEFSHFAEFLDE